MRSLPEKLALMCARVAEHAEAEVVGVYDAIDETRCRVPRLEAQLLRAHRELVKLRECSKLPALFSGGEG